MLGFPVRPGDLRVGDDIMVTYPDGSGTFNAEVLFIGPKDRRHPWRLVKECIRHIQDPMEREMARSVHMEFDMVYFKRYDGKIDRFPIAPQTLSYLRLLPKEDNPNEA